MSHDCVIEFGPSGDHVSLRVSGPELLGPGGKKYVRPAPNLPAAMLDDLRRGQPSEQTVDEASGKISEWLFNPDFDLDLVLGLAAAVKEPWRLVFRMNGLDDLQIRSKLVDMPLEMIVQQGGNTPYALHQKIGAIVHTLEKVGNAPTSLTADTYPLRVLIVRSNPKDLGGEVPPAAPVRDKILELRPDLVPRFLQVDILSREAAAGVAGPPTREQLLQQLKSRYDLLIYLGHGDILEGHADVAPVGVLQLEGADDDSIHDALPANKFGVYLQNHPVPVVLLVGCLTAAHPTPQQQAYLATALPRWMQGSQGVAQALINSQSGVQVVVGMRFKIERDDALNFLNAFFKSLLDEAADSRAGDVEEAVRRGREALHLLSAQAASWCAPTIFRAPGDEPTFPFLKQPPECPIQEAEQDARAELWPMLAVVNWKLRAGGNPIAGRLHGYLKLLEMALVQKVTNQNSALIMPAQLEARPEDKNVVVPFALCGAINLHSLEGTINVRGGEITLQPGLQPAIELTAQGFQLEVVVPAGLPQPTQLRFRIVRAVGSAPLAAGPLFSATANIPDAVAAVYTIGVDELKSDPPRSLCPAKNAIVVPAP